MPDQEPTVHDRIAEPAPEPGAPTLAHEPVEEEQDWFDEPEELPRRPRRRLLTPVPIALVAVLLVACGFIGGVLVEKGQGGTSSSATAGSGLAARLAGLRGTRGTGTGTGATDSAGGAAGTLGGAGGGATTGQVAFIQGSTLYVTNTQGNTVKVATSRGSTVTKSVSSSVKAIHPGETVVVLGEAAANGTVTAESIRVGVSGGGGLGSLLGGSGASGGGSGASSGAGGGTGAGGGPALFGPGG